MTDVRLTALNPVDSQVYPVACNTSGELLVADGGPDLTVTGDLTVEGTASFNSDVYIDSSGKVGIGTATPELKLSVLSDNYPAVQIVRNNSSFAAGIRMENSSGRGGVINSISDQNGGGLRFYGYTSNVQTERMIIGSSGNVGINNTNPSAKLDVDGTGNFTGDVTAPNISSLMNAVVDLTNRISILEAN